MKTPCPNRITTLVRAASLAAALCLCASAPAVIVGPYTADSSTLHLWHMDTNAVPVLDAVSTGGTNLMGLLNGAVLGSNSFTGFGLALSTYDGGPTGTVATAKDAILSANPASSVAIPMSYADPTSGAFTYEALVRIDFDPAQNQAPAPAGNGRNSTMMIMSAESSANANRIFQFRLDPVGTLGGTNTVPCLEFINVHAAVAPVENLMYVPIPTTGPNAIVSNQWYHVAVTFNGLPNTAGNLKYYWTLLNPTNTSANLIGSVTMTNKLPVANVQFAVGNSGRGTPNGNFLGLIDEVRISKVGRGPSGMMFAPASVAIDTQPASQFVAAGETLTLNCVASGGVPLGYQWQLNATNLPGATNSGLVIANITTNQAGPYRVIVTNIGSGATSAVATVRVGALFREVFNTGVSSPGIAAAGATVDSHYQLVQSDDPTYPGPAAIVATGIPAVWLANTTNSQWIAPVANAVAIGGNYTYRTAFLLDSLDPTNAQLTLNWAVDNLGLDIRLNGVSLGQTNGGFTSLTSIVVTNGFVTGSNFLECVVSNLPGTGPNQTGLRAELKGVALPLPPTPLQLVGLPADVTTLELHNASFTVTAIGSGPLNYQWYHDATLLNAQTNRTLLLTAVKPADAGIYTVYVTNSLGYTNAAASLKVTTPPALVWTGVNNADWDLLTTNWLDTASSADAAFSQNDYVLFDSRGSAQPTVNLTQELIPNAIVVSADTDYTLTSFALNGSLSGIAALTKSGAGKLILDVTNNLTGPVLIQSGTLQVGNSDTAGTLGSGPITNNSILSFTRADGTGLPNTIHGPGTLSFDGYGSVTLQASNDYSGLTLINAGIVYLQNGAGLGSTNLGTSVAIGAQLYINANVDVGFEALTLSGSGDGNGALRKGGSGVTTYAGPLTLAADATLGVDGGATLNLTNSAMVTGTNVNLTLAGLGAGIAYSPLSLGSGYLDKEGTGTWTLVATNNTWTGGTVINAGTLAIGNGSPSGSFGQGDIADNAALVFNTGLDLAVTNTIGGTGTVSQNGTNTLTLAGTNSYSGVTYANGGTLIPANPAALGDTNGNTSIAGNLGAVSRVALTGNLTLAEPFLMAGRQPAPDVSAFAAHLVNLSGTNILTGPLTSTAGGNQYNIESAAGLLIVAADYSQAAGTGVRLLNLQGAGQGNWTGAINDGTAITTVTKRGSGTWILSGTNGFSGTTTVSNGTLVINGQIGTNAVTVQTNAVLAGNGSIGGPVTVQAGGTLAPTGTLTIGNTLALLAGGTNQMSTNSEVIGLSAVTYGGTLALQNLPGALSTGNAFKLFAAAAYGGSFANIVPATPGVGLLWDTNTLATDGTLRIKSGIVPQPHIVSVGLNGSGQLVFQGTNGTPGGGYSVLSSTNVAAPLTAWLTNTTGTFTGTGTFSNAVPVNAAVPQDFYLLRVP